MCADDEAQLVLFTALDVIEYVLLLPNQNLRTLQFSLTSDTKLIAKSLVADITSRTFVLSSTPQGRRALFYLLVPRTRRHFTPSQIFALSETDSIRSKTSKKDKDVRKEEIRKAASGALIEFVEQKGDVVARDTGGSLVVTEIMLYAEGGEYRLSLESIDRRLM
jgi:pumilio family protein 6